MRQCPHCQRTDQQVKCGKTAAGSQLYLCKVCQRKYTPFPKSRRYPLSVRHEALALITKGYSQRQAARQLGISHVVIGNWFKALTRGK